MLTLLGSAILAVIGLTLLFVWFSHGLPDVDRLARYRPFATTRVFDLQGHLLAEYADEYRLVVPMEAIPKRLIRAFLAAEDQQFYEHPGINPARIVAAAIADLRAGRPVQGGSTITQQLAKNLFLSRERSLARKIREAILAWRLERRFSKNRILWLYLNHIYLGRGAYGVAAAAWRYFGKRLDELTLAECAMLAGLPKAPSKYAPHRHPKAALARRNTVLRLMADAGFVSRREAEEAMREPLVVIPAPFASRMDNAYGDRVYRELVARFGEPRVRRDGLVVFVPYREQAEAAAIRAVKRGVLAIEERTPYRYPDHLDDEARAAWLEQAARRAPEAPPGPLEPRRALVLEAKDGTLTLTDGRHTWTIPAPDWRWEKPSAEERNRNPERHARPARWTAGDLVWVRGDGAGGVRLTQRTDVEAALYAVDLESGYPLARVGGFDFHFRGFDRVDAERQPGSAMKPFLYATALDHGWTPASIVIDAPLVFDNPELGDFWRPENYSGRFAGPVTLRNALEHSRNLASVRLLMDLGTRRFVRALERNYAFRRRFDPQLALALGVSEVRLEDLVHSYLVFASGGLRWRPEWIAEVDDRDGHALFRGVPGIRCAACHGDGELAAAGPGMRPPERTLDATTAFLITNMMRGVVERGTGRRARALGRPAAGKTGTTNDQADAWFVGFTPQVLTGVWVGRDRHEPIGRHETGAHAALPIWLEAMRAFHEGRPVKDFPVPPGIEWAPIDQETGKLATPESRDVVLEAFRAGTAPQPERDDGDPGTR